MNLRQALEDAIPLVIVLLGLLETFAQSDPKYAIYAGSIALIIKFLNSIIPTTPPKPTTPSS